MIHDRDAHADVLRILREETAPERVVFHAFSGDAAMARECVAAGYVLSFPGVVTFRNAPALREAAAVTPIEQMLVETDAPFLTPHPLRGRPNSPRLLPLTVRALARRRPAPISTGCARPWRVRVSGCSASTEPDTAILTWALHPYRADMPYLFEGWQPSHKRLLLHAPVVTQP